MKTQNDILCYMKATCSTFICLTALALNTALSQPAPVPHKAPIPQPPPGPTDQATFSSRLQDIISRASQPTLEPTLTKFNLDFPGGTPKQLVTAIEKATGRPLNAIVPDEHADTKLPALKMTGVTVPQLFQAVGQAGGVVTVGNIVYSRYGFTTLTTTPSEDSIWYFSMYKAPALTKICRFYSLATYLDGGLSVDDITTAIETGWKLMGETNPPTISFHKDTKLLIAVGDERKLETISDVLKALQPPMTGWGVGGYGGGFTPPAPRTIPRSPAPAAK